MALHASHEVTRLLKAWGSGDQGALEELAPLVQNELHRVAHRYMVREKPGHTLQTTALINEVYLQLPDVRKVRWHDRVHFFAICARLMRRILTDYARSRQSLKRGAAAPHLSLDEVAVWASESCGNLVALDDALSRLAAIDPRKSQVVELRFFGGLSLEESADVLNVSPVTVARDWKLAKAWLYKELNPDQ